METQTENYTLEQIVESLFDFTDYSAEEKESVIAETTGMLTESALLRSLDDAGEEVQNTFNDFVATNPNEEQMMEWIQGNLPDFEKTLVEEIQIFQNMDEETATEK